jgi:hypothetical protein
MLRLIFQGSLAGAGLAILFGPLTYEWWGGLLLFLAVHIGVEYQRGGRV